MIDTYIKWNNEEIDELKENIRWRISAWYDEYYHGDPTVKKDHLILFERRYYRSLFSNNSLEEDINKFLISLQEEFNRRLI